MKSILFAAILALAATQVPASAAGIADRYTVELVRVDSTGLGYVQFTTPLTGTPPACTQSDYVKVLSFDTNTPGGKAILATVLQAKATDGIIYARGSGTCANYSVMESWTWGYVQ